MVPFVGEHLLEFVDVLVALAPDLLGDQVVHAHDEHVLVVAAVEDGDLALAGRSRWTRQRKSCSSSSALGLLNGDAHAERADAVDDVLDRAVLARGVHPLEHDQHLVFVPRRRAIPAARPAPTAPRSAPWASALLPSKPSVSSAGQSGSTTLGSGDGCGSARSPSADVAPVPTSGEGPVVRTAPITNLVGCHV